MQETDWKPLREFPGYSVHRTGKVRNDDTGCMMKTGLNQGGTPMVGLTRDGVQYRRSLALLVAISFIPQLDGRFDTPIHLNGDTLDNHVDNLVWRPRWFAVKYKRQFLDEATLGPPRWRIRKDIWQADDHDKVWANSWDCARYNGLLELHLCNSIVNKMPVFPTWERYQVVPV